MLTTSPPDDPQQPTSCRCWNCCFSYWLFEQLEPPPYYVKLPCVWNCGQDVPNSVTDVISTIVINIGLPESMEFWSNYHVAVPHLEYYQQMGFRVIKLNKQGFFCTSCKRPAEWCECEVLALPESGFPDFQLHLRCPCCQSYEQCSCSYRYEDFGPGEYTHCEWTTLTKRTSLKIRAAEMILWTMLSLCTRETVPPHPGFQYAPHIEVYGEESYWKVAYDLEPQLYLIPHPRCAYEGLNALHSARQEPRLIATL